MRKKQIMKWVLAFIIIAIIVILIKNSSGLIKPSIPPIIITPFPANADIYHTMGCAVRESGTYEQEVNSKTSQCKYTCAMSNLDYLKYKCIRDVLTCYCKQY